MISEFFTKTVNVKRLEKNASTGHLNTAVVYENMPCAIQSMEAVQSLVGRGALLKKFQLWADESYVLKEGDEIIDGSTTYGVEGAVIEVSVAGRENHTHAILTLAQNA